MCFEGRPYRITTCIDANILDVESSLKAMNETQRITQRRMSKSRVLGAGGVLAKDSQVLVCPVEMRSVLGRLSRRAVPRARVRRAGAGETDLHA